MTTSNVTNFSTENFNNSTINNSHSNITDIIQIPLFSLIIIVASIYIILVLSHKTFRAKKFMWLAVNICFSSLFFSVIQLLSSGVRLSNIPETTMSCRSKGFIITMASCHIMYSHCIAAFCRLLSIQYPLKPLFRSSHWLLGNIAMSEIIGTLIALPSLFFDGFACTSTYGARFLRIYTAISTVFVPIAIVFGCNIAIFRYVRRSSKRIHDANNNNGNRLNNRDMYLCKIILLTFCVFFVGWAPLFVEQLFFNDQTRLSSGLSTFLNILPSISLLADVLLLIYSDKPVRKLLLKVLACNMKIPCLFNPIIRK